MWGKTPNGEILHAFGVLPTWQRFDSANTSKSNKSFDRVNTNDS